MLLTFAVKLALAGPEWMQIPATRPIEWVYLSVYPLYAVAMMFPYVHMRLRGYALRNLVALQGLLACTLPIYISSVLLGLFRSSREFKITPKQSVGEVSSIWNRPQPYVFFVLLATGSIIFDQLLSQRAVSFAWILMVWMYIWSLSASHIFIFAWQSKARNGFKSVPMGKPHEPSERDVAQTETAV
jgi:hypothetical protein